MTFKQILKSPIAKQLMGATVGGTLALGIYYGYEYSAPTVTAWLTVPQASDDAQLGRVARVDDDSLRTTRQQIRASRIVEQHGQPAEEVEEVIPDPEGWDLEALEEPTEDEWAGWEDAWDDSAEVAETEEELQPAAPLNSLNDGAGWDDGWDDWGSEWDPAPVASVTTPDPYVQPVAAHTTPEALPDSGFELWAILTLALGVSGYRHRRKLREWLTSWQHA